MNALILLMLYSTASAAERLPNIVLIVADDMGYGDAGCYGAKDIRTPHIDRLAKEGTRFTSFNVAQAVCTASRAALLTGCYPNRIGMAGALNHTSREGIHPDELLLSEMCKSRGYATACFGKWHLGTRPAFDPLKHGFDTWCGLPYSNDNGPRHPTIRNLPPLPLIEDGTVIATNPDMASFTRLFTDKSLKFIDDNKAKPFFLYVPHVMPHVPIAASKQYAGRSRRGVYGDVIEELDSSVGEIMEALKKHELERHTIVIFLSDNGPFLSYGSHAGSAGPFREGKLTCYEGGVRVPFIVKWPDHVPAGRVCDEFLTGLDVTPTLAKLIGAELPKHRIDGEDTSPLWLGERQRRRDDFAYYNGSELQAIRHKNLKLHIAHDYLTVGGPAGKDGKPANFETMKPLGIEQSGIRGIASRHGYQVARQELALYDLSTDPGETKNLAESDPATVKLLLKLATSFRRDLGDDIMNERGRMLRPAGRD